MRLPVIFLLAVLLLWQCASVDPLDSRTNVTKSLLVKSSGSSIFGSGSLLYQDTFAIMRPIVDIAAVTSDKWKYSVRGNTFYSPGMLDSPDQLKQEIFEQTKEEMEWYSFIRRKFRYRKYITIEEGPELRDNVIKEVMTLESTLDSSRLDTMPLAESFVSLLESYPANHFVIYHMKMRYWWETFGHYGHPAVFFMSRVFILDKRGRRIFFYNRIYDVDNKRRLIHKFLKKYLD